MWIDILFGLFMVMAVFKGLRRGFIIAVVSAAALIIAALSLFLYLIQVAAIGSPFVAISG